MVATKDNFCTVLHPKGLRTSPHLLVVWAFKFEAQHTRAAPMWPQVFLKTPVRVKKGDLVQLSWLPEQV